ncbi:hypothetical protein PR048_013191 [Dryococelus australis]|uniref:ATP-dependent DNA helicase n=1 Tax=Dryococelus australis TaxID=614101 RepID=A0ABQ9HRK0_9NEOP|nr:hypothetical protein PR048_013191 [Dryococelus australis]
MRALRRGVSVVKVHYRPYMAFTHGGGGCICGNDHPPQRFRRSLMPGCGCGEGLLSALCDIYTWGDASVAMTTLPATWVRRYSVTPCIICDTSQIRGWSPNGPAGSLEVLHMLLGVALCHSAKVPKESNTWDICVSMPKMKILWRIPASRSYREKNCSQKQKPRERLLQHSENLSSDDDCEPSQCTSSHQTGALTLTTLKRVQQSAHFHVNQKAGPSHAPDPPVCISRGADSRRRSSCLHVITEPQQSHAPEPAVALPTVSSDAGILSGSILMDETIVQQLLELFYEEESAPVLILQRRRTDNRKGQTLRQVTLTLKPGLGKDPNVYNLPAAVNEVAAIFVGDVPPMKHNIRIYPKEQPAHFISPPNALTDPMTYPLLFHMANIVSHPIFLFLWAGKAHVSMLPIFSSDNVPLWQTRSLHHFHLLIAMSLEVSQQECHRPDVVCKLFKKWGLPHAHILIILDKGDKIAMSEVVDETVWADIPDRDDEPALYDFFKTHMLHTNCGPSAPYFRDSFCRFHFPKAFSGETLLQYLGFIRYRKPHNNSSATIGTNVDDNRHVIPYSPNVLHKYQCHTNVEICLSFQATRYLYKYIHKGHNSAVLQVGIVITMWQAHWIGCVRSTPPHCILTLQISAQVASPLWHQCVWVDTMSSRPYLCGTPTALMLDGKTMHVDGKVNEKLLCLRLLMHNDRDPTFFEDLHTVRHNVHPTYKLACMNLLLLDRNYIYQVTMYEVARWSVPGRLKVLFTQLFQCNIADPLVMYNNFKPYLLDDMGDDLEASKNRALMHLNEVMAAIAAADSDAEARCRVFFVDGPGGSGKTFLYNCIIHSLCANSKIVCRVAWTGIASILLAGGNTSLFKLPVPVMQGSVCDISAQLPEAELLRKCSLIIWYEGLMAPKEALHCVDRLLRDMTKINCTKFGGKVLLLGGDFRQVLPVVSHRGRADQVNACLKNSPLWPSFKQLCLRTNMRVDQGQEEFQQFLLHIGPLWPSFKQLCLRTNMRVDQGQEEFQQFLLHIGEGTYPPILGLPEGYVELPDFLVLPENADICSHVFGHELLTEEVISTQVILYPHNEDVDKMNAIMVAQLGGHRKTFLSHDQLDDSSEDSMNVPIEFLNSLTVASLPPHSLTLAVESCIMLIRNLDTKHSLCNGTRLVVININGYVIDAKIITGSYKGNRAYIPRIKLLSAPTNFPCSFSRRQFHIC